MLFSYQAVANCDNIDLWLLDNGCNKHMTGNKSFFSSLDDFVETKVKLGDYSFVDV